MPAFHTALLLALLFVTAALAQPMSDLCQTTRTLPNIQRRGTNIDVPTNTSQVLCDDMISGCYIVEPPIASSFVPAGKCGTNTPAFATQSLPTEQGSTLPITVCLSSSTSNSNSQCTVTRQINATRCGMHYVYCLVPLPRVGDDCAAYCVNAQTSGEFDPVPTPPPPPAPVPVSTDPDDCMFENTMNPPWITGLYPGGVCDLSTSTGCRTVQVNLSARNPVSATQTVYCRYREIWVDESGPFVLYTVPIMYTEAMRVDCSTLRCDIPRIPVGDKEIIPGFLLSISRDMGANYGNEKPYVPYDGRCWLCDFDYNPVCRLKPGYCFIEGACYMNGTLKEQSTTEICDPERSTTEFSVVGDGCRDRGLTYRDGEKPIAPELFCLQCLPEVSTEQLTVVEGCYTDNTCFAEGARSMTTPCLMCRHDKNPTGFSPSPDYCYINNMCYRRWQSSGTTPCETCDPDVSQDSFSPLPNRCKVNGVCYSPGDRPGQTCLGCDPSVSRIALTPIVGCYIDGRCYMENEQSPSATCRRCRGGESRTEFTTTVGCYINGQCVDELTPSPAGDCRICQNAVNPDDYSPGPDFCYIQGRCYNRLAPEFPGSCRACVPEDSQDEFSILPNRCYVGGQCYIAGFRPSTSTCLQCIPSVSREMFSPMTGCFIDGACRAEGEPEGSQSCLQCRRADNPTEWTVISGCFVDGRCYVENERSTLEPCRQCVVSQSRTELTTTEGCYINNQCVDEGTVDPFHTCRACRGLLDRYDYSPRPDVCFINKVCYLQGATTGTLPCRGCNAAVSQTETSTLPGYCFVDGQCYAENFSPPGRPCAQCLPDITTDDFSPSSTNTFTCYINGQCYNDGDVGPDPCLRCVVSQSRTEWTIGSGWCYINDQCVQEGAVNGALTCMACNSARSQTEYTIQVDTCYIDGVCYASDEASADNVCMVCSPGVSQTSFSNAGTCAIGNRCYQEGQQDPLNFCRVCNSARNPTGFSISDNACYIGNQCYSSGQREDPSQFCRQCAPTISQFQFSVVNGCFINNRCYPPNGRSETDPCDVCIPSSSTSVFTPTDGCIIDNTCVTNGFVNPNNPCQMCDTSIMINGYSERTYQTTSGPCSCTRACQKLSNDGNSLLFLCTFPTSGQQLYSTYCSLTNAEDYNTIPCTRTRPVAMAIRFCSPPRDPNEAQALANACAAQG